MKYVRIYSGDDGQSHFEDVEVDLADHGPLGRISDLVRGKGVVFREVEGEYHYVFHNAPRRQFVVNLTGSVRRMEPGSILLAEDLTGQGHVSRSVNGEPRTCLFIPLADD